jgi:effector-binding domain-containing protein
VVLSWYLFIRPYEFEVNFKAKTLPGDVIETIRLWDRSMANSEILDVDSLSSLKQSIASGGNKYIYDWHFTLLNDSTTSASIKITEPSNSLMNKILIPFSLQPVEEDADSIIRSFYQILKSHLDITKVKLDGEVYLDSKFCACTTKETSQTAKANGMMLDYGLITSFISEHNLTADGPPMVRVLNWDHNQGKLKFDFCFPIIQQDSLPQVSEITYKLYRDVKALMATYNGNYITSDRAWYYLIHYAEKQGYSINGLPIEYFYNNPNLGANEREWKAEIYLPVK